MNELTDTTFYPDFSSISFTYSKEEYEFLGRCLELNGNDIFSALEVFVDRHPCDTKQVLMLWGPMAQAILSGETWESKIQELGRLQSISLKPQEPTP